MDRQTLDAYERQAEAIFSRHTRFDRTTHHERLLAWLRPGEPTADSGSCSGADLAWLVSQGFPAVGYEPGAGLRQLAIATFPEVDVGASSLPDLVDGPDGAFGNVVCSAVLMHLPLASILPAIASLSRILRPGGRLLLSYCPGKDGAPSARKTAAYPARKWRNRTGLRRSEPPLGHGSRVLGRGVLDRHRRSAVRAHPRP